MGSPFLSLLSYTFCRISKSWESSIVVVCFLILSTCDYFTSNFHYSMCDFGLAMDCCRCLVDKANRTYEVGHVISNTKLLLH